MKDSKVSSTKSKKKIILLSVLVIAFILVLGGYHVYASQKSMAENRIAMEKQRQVMIEHWQEEGLSEEEIQEKIRGEMQSQQGDFERPWYSEMLRTVRHATGSGPGDGSRMGGRPPEGQPQSNQ